MAEHQRFIVRLQERLAKYDASSPELQMFMARTGSEIVNIARANITKNRITDTGRLLNSIGFRMQAEGGGTLAVYAGAFNIRYAAIHEFGMRYTPLMLRAMFASLRNRGLLDKRPGKGVMVGGVLPPRPYLVPAFRSATENFAMKMRDYLRTV